MKKVILTCVCTLGWVISGFSQIYTPPNGTVGIGVPTPIEMLDVQGNIHARGTLISSISGEIGAAVHLINDAKTGAGTAIRWALYNMTGSHYGNSLQFWAYDTGNCTSGLCHSRFTIMDNGNVGIGVNFPQARLAVNGGIVATKIKVNQNLTWPDYVFEPAYKLPSLYELEQFIKQHKHLPEVPSAATVAQDGIDLGDNQALLLKKIEELTLYVIELKKEIDALKKQN